MRHPNEINFFLPRAMSKKPAIAWIGTEAEHGALDKERKAIMKQWAKREEQIERVMGATVWMYGDLQGIAGKSLQEIEGLELRSLTLNAEQAAE